MEEIIKLIKENKAKNIEQEEDLISFSIKGFNIKIQIEDEIEGDIQYWIESIDDIELPQEYYEHYLEFGYVHDFEMFLDAIINGEYNFIKKIYNAINKLSETYEEDFDIFLKHHNPYFH